MICSNRHSFDQARSGYVNLLPVNQKRTKQPGDNKQMVHARTQFLDAGYYSVYGKRLHNVSQRMQPIMVYCWMSAVEKGITCKV